MLHPDLTTEEISGYLRGVNHDDLTDSLAPGEAIRLLMRIEEEGTPLERIPPMVARSGRLRSLSLSPPPKPS